MVASTAEQKRLKFAGSRFKRSLDSFADGTTLHGLRNICSSHSGIFRKLLWFTLLLCMASMCLYMGSQSVRKFLKYESITRVEKKTVSQLDFPAVSICDQNLFSRNAFRNEELGNITRDFPVDEDTLVDIIQKIHAGHYEDFNETEFDEAVAMLDQLSLYRMVKESSEANKKNGDLFFDCKFDGVPFDCDAGFKFLMTQKAACYTFQSERKVIEHGQMSTERPGYQHGLGKNFYCYFFLDI